MSRRGPAHAPRPTLVDVRGTRFGAALTTTVAVLAIAATRLAPRAALATTGVLALVLLASALGGPRWNLWGHGYRVLVAPRLAPPSPEQREPAEPPRFAAAVGGLLLATAVVVHIAGPPLAASGLLAVVAVLAALNATTGLCVGCRLYGALVLRPRARAAAKAAPQH